MYLSEEEPFIDSGSEYAPDSESETGALSSGEDKEISENNSVTEEHVTDINLNESDDPIQNIQEFGIQWDSHDFVPTIHKFDNSNSGMQNENLINETREAEKFLTCSQKK